MSIELMIPRIKNIEFQFGVLCIAIVLAIGCGQIPGISENRKNFAPWEKMPPGDGILYLDKFVRDPGIDPIYLALMSYEDESDVQKVVDTFGLVQSSGLTPDGSFADSLSNPPAWYPLKTANKLYIFPESPHQYYANLWVDSDSKTMIIERSWW